MRVYRHRYKKRQCNTALRDSVTSYLLVVLVMSVIIYTLLANKIFQYQPDILYVDKDTLDVERSGRYAVLVKRDHPRNTSYVFQRDRETLQIGGRYTGSAVKMSDLTYNFVESKANISSLLLRKNRRVSNFSCKKMFNSDADELLRAKVYMSSNKRTKTSNAQLRVMTSDCDKFKLNRGYLDSPVTEMEKNFPIAYSIVAYKRVEQIERLLRAIYRPQNYYCIHMDAKSFKDDYRTVASIASCFDNVFMASRRIDVRWGTYSVLETELTCMKDLYAKKDWKYFINLTGQEFPIKTNLEIVKILTAMKGANLVDGTWIRARRNYLYRWTKTDVPPPHGIRPIKGSLHVAVNREFVKFALYNKISKDFLKWLNTTEIPDETFFSSLNHNPHLKIPGTFLGEPEEYPMKPTITRYKNWDIGHGVWARKCGGKYVRSICILGVSDLTRLKDDISLFANKFYIEYQPLAYDCLEELMYNRTRDQYLEQQRIDVTFYSMLDQVTRRLMV